MGFPTTKTKIYDPIQKHDRTYRMRLDLHYKESLNELVMLEETCV